MHTDITVSSFAHSGVTDHPAKKLLFDVDEQVGLVTSRRAEKKSFV